VLRHVPQRHHHPPIHQAEIARIQRDFNLGNPVDQPVEKPRRLHLEPAFAFPLLPDCINDVISFFPSLNHLGDDLRWILQIRVDKDDGLPIRIVQPGRHRDLMAEVPGEAQDTHLRSAGLQLAHQLQRVILAAVIDHDQLPRLAQSLHNGADPVIEGLDIALLIVNRCNNRIDRPSRHHAHPRPS